MAYHLISYDFEQYNFEKFRKEERDYKGKVYWSYGKRRHKFNKGDICYIYCVNLPDMTNRILLRAEIAESETKDPQNPELNCFTIKNIKSIRLKEPEEANKNMKDLTFGYENLKSIYNINTVQGKQKLDADGKHRALVERLEEDFKNGLQENLNEVKKHYDNMTKCVFDGHDHNPNMHKTFIKPNGFNYFETHHVIQQKTSRNRQLSKKIVEDSRNKVYLCPTCHRKIHFSNVADVRKMLKYLYESNKSFYDDCSQKAGATNTLTWLYEMYNCQE